MECREKWCSVVSGWKNHNKLLKLSGKKTLSRSSISQLLLIDRNGNKRRLKCFPILPLEERCLLYRVFGKISTMTQTVTNQFILISNWISIYFYSAIYIYICLQMCCLFFFLFKERLGKKSEIVILVLFILLFCFELAFIFIF